MPFVEYMLLAILGSTSVTAARGGSSTPMFTADSVTQPSGAAAGHDDFNLAFGLEGHLEGQAGGGSPGHASKTDTGKKPVHHTATRHHRRHHRSGPRPPIPPASSRNAAHKG